MFLKLPITILFGTQENIQFIVLIVFSWSDIFSSYELQAKFLAKLIFRVNAQSLSCVQLFVTPWTVAHQVPLSMKFPMQKYWNIMPSPSPRDLPDPGVELSLFPMTIMCVAFFFFLTLVTLTACRWTKCIDFSLSQRLLLSVAVYLGILLSFPYCLAHQSCFATIISLIMLNSLLIFSSTEYGIVRPCLWGIKGRCVILVYPK